MRLTISQKKNTAAARPSSSGPPGSAAFLVGRLGTEAARRFAERLKPLGLTPPHAGVLRLLTQSPEANQRELAAALGLHAPRLVLVLDEMQQLGLLSRADSSGDRRSNAVVLTAKGRQAFAAVSQIGRAHSEELFAGLAPAERKQLAELLQKVAGNLGIPNSGAPNSARVVDSRTRKIKSPRHA